MEIKARKTQEKRVWGKIRIFSKKKTSLHYIFNRSMIRTHPYIDLMSMGKLGCFTRFKRLFKRDKVLKTYYRSSFDF